MTPHPRPRFLVMAKPPVPGQVKTRLTHTHAGLSPQQAAAVHAAMLAALLARLQHLVDAGQANLTLAVATDDDLADPLSWLDWLEHAFQHHPHALQTLQPAAQHPGFQLVPQSTGHLGQRIQNAWPTTDPSHASSDSAPAVILGVDSPDLPRTHLQAALAVAAQQPLTPNACPADAADPQAQPQAAIGPTPDGGYWTLAAPACPAPLLDASIDWGTPAVYDQTHDQAQQHTLRLVDLPAWHDVDTPQDLQQLQARLAQLPDAEPPLRELARHLQTITDP